MNLNYNLYLYSISFYLQSKIKFKIMHNLNSKIFQHKKRTPMMAFDISTYEFVILFYVCQPVFLSHFWYCHYFLAQSVSNSMRDTIWYLFFCKLADVVTNIFVVGCYSVVRWLCLKCLLVLCFCIKYLIAKAQYFLPFLKIFLERNSYRHLPI